MPQLTKPGFGGFVTMQLAYFPNYLPPAQASAAKASITHDRYLPESGIP
jgi:hypothetical protein